MQAAVGVEHTNQAELALTVHQVLKAAKVAAELAAARVLLVEQVAQIPVVVVVVECMPHRMHLAQAAQELLL
jgi:nanoRNase/pAp phosphatase (c-di-AMP/oligoRNAs hydrolase)